MSINVELTHNFDEVGRVVQHIFSDQMPFATAQAINDSAKQAQKVQRTHQLSVFDVRRKGWMERAVKLKPRATKQKAEAKLSIDPPLGRGGRSRRSVLTQHEEDARKHPLGGSVAVPTSNVPRTASGIIPKKWRPRQLLASGVTHGRVTVGKITRFGVKRGGKTFKGRRAAFLIRKPGGRGTIFERDDRDLLPLYQLVPSVPLDQRLSFVDNVTRSVLSTYNANFVKRFDQATRSAR